MSGSRSRVWIERHTSSSAPFNVIHEHDGGSKWIHSGCIKCCTRVYPTYVSVRSSKSRSLEATRTRSQSMRIRPSRASCCCATVCRSVRHLSLFNREELISGVVLITSMGVLSCLTTAWWGSVRHYIRVIDTGCNISLSSSQIVLAEH